MTRSARPKPSGDPGTPDASASPAAAIAVPPPTRLFNRDFVLMLQGSFVSRLGDVVYSIAIGFYVYHLTGSASLMGVFASLSMFLNMFLGPLAGALADRIDRRAAIVSVDVLRGLVMLGIGALVLAGRLDVGSLFGFSVVAALLGVLFNPTAGTVLIDIVPKAEFVRSRSVASTAQTLVDLVGKAASGLLLVYVGVGELILFNGVSFLVNALLVAFVRIPRTPKQGTPIRVRTLLVDLREGLAAVVATKGLNMLFFSAILINFLGSGFYNLILVFTTEKGYPLEQYGFLMTALSVGALLGSLLVAAVKMAPKRRPGVLFASFLTSMAFLAAGLLLRPFAAVAAMFLLAELTSAVGNTILNASLLLLVPSDKRATVMGFLMSSSIGGMALSTVAYGFAADYFPVTAVALVGTLLSLAPLCWLLLHRDVQGAIVESSGGGSPA